MTTAAAGDLGEEVFSVDCTTTAAGLSVSGGPAALYIPVGSPNRSPSSVVVTPASGSSLELPSSPTSTSMKQPLQQLPDVANQLTLQVKFNFKHTKTILLY
jgi:hypothetical protein